MNKKQIELFELIKENPKLPVMPFVSNDCVKSYDYGYWRSSLGDSWMDEIYQEDEDVYFKSYEFEYLVQRFEEEMYNDDPDFYELLGESKIEQLAIRKAENLDWENVIVMAIEPM